VNSGFLGVMTASYQSASMTVAHAQLSKYFDGLYFTGTMPPISIAGVPFAAIIDMQTGELALADVTAQINAQTFLVYAEMLNED
jgi:hypothetical protein